MTISGVTKNLWMMVMVILVMVMVLFITYAHLVGIEPSMTGPYLSTHLKNRDRF